MNGISSQISDGLAVAWASSLVFLPKLLMFVIILVAGYFVAKLLARGLDSLLKRLNFDTLVERGGLKPVLQKSGFNASSFLSKLLFYGLFLLVLQLAFGMFGPNPVSELLTRIIAYIPNIVVAVIIVIVSAAVAKAVKDILAVSLGGLSYGRSLASLASAAIAVIGAFAALDQLDIAPHIVQGVFYATLALLAGSAIIALGGGGVQSMRARWEQTLNKVEGRTQQFRDPPEQAGGEADGWKHRSEGMSTPYPSSPSQQPRDLYPH